MTSAHSLPMRAKCCQLTCTYHHISTPRKMQYWRAFRDVRMIVSMSLHASCFGHQLHWSRKVVVVTYSWNKLGHSGWAAGELMKWPRSQIAQSINTRFKKHSTAVLFPWHKKTTTNHSDRRNCKVSRMTSRVIKSKASTLRCKRLLQLTFQQRLQGFHQRLRMHRAYRTMVDAVSWHRSARSSPLSAIFCQRETRPKHLNISRSSRGPTAGPTAKVSNKQESCSMDAEECSLYSL